MHVVVIVHREFVDGRWYRPSCTCGWVGAWFYLPVSGSCPFNIKENKS
jgi:hypothetical protein